VKRSTEVDGEMCVIVPLRVIEESDAKEVRREHAIAWGCAWSAELDRGLFPGGDPGAVKLREGHGDTVELSRRSPSYRSADADDEILDVADHVLHFAGGVQVMTADSTIRVRARSDGSKVLFVPEEWLRLAGNPEPSADVLELEAVDRQDPRLERKDAPARSACEHVLTARTCR